MTTENPPAQTSPKDGNLQLQAPTIITEPIMMKKRTHWEVQYARFFTFPVSFSSSSAATTANTSSLRPLTSSRKRRRKGTWVPSSSSNVSLRILSNRHHSLTESILVVSLNETIYEEHYISKLHFTWPAMLGFSDCSGKGSSVIFASYRDSMSQMQKFALRFSSSSESHTFMESLKWLKEASTVESPSHMSSRVFHQRIDEEPNHVNSSVEYAPQRQPSVKQEHVSYSCSQQAVVGHAVEGADVALPPSFSALLADCCTKTEPAGVSQAPAQNGINHLQTLGTLTGYSLIDMLDKIESVITGLGGDLAF